MIYQKQKWQAYDPNKSEEENIKNGAVGTAERMNHIESGIAEIDSCVSDLQQKYDDLDTLTQLNLQAILFGKRMTVENTVDFKNKVSGNQEKNANSFYRTNSGSLLTPFKDLWTENTQSHYNAIMQLDGTTTRMSWTNTKGIAQNLFKYDVVTSIEKDYSILFDLAGVTTLEEKVNLVRQFTDSSLGITVHGVGSGAFGNQCTLQLYHTDGTYKGSQTNRTAELQPLAYVSEDMNAYLQDDGCIYAIIYAASSDGKTPTTLNIDYAQLDYTLAFRFLDIYTSKKEYTALEKRVQALEKER